MGALKIAVVVMGVLIVGGTVTLGVLLLGRMSSASGPIASLLLDEPSGSRIAQVSAAQDRVVLRIEGGGPDRAVVVDTRSLRVVGRIGVAR